MKKNFLNTMVAVCLLVLLFALIPAVAAQATDQVTGTLNRGSRFTVTITGYPNTPYYVWLGGTFTMTGEPYDQPPIISGSTQGLVQDPPGGPYVIGSYPITNGGGRTILDDVAPSTASMSNTNYYAQVTTDETGRAVVEFRTSVYTAVRRYSVRVENPTSSDTNLQIQENVYNNANRPMVVTPAESFVITTVATTIPAPIPPSVVETPPATTLVPPPAPPTTRRSGLEPAILIGALAAGALAAIRRD